MKISKTLLIILILLFKSVVCFAQWSIDTTINNPVSTSQNDQSFPKIVSDGAGGAIIVWNDDRNGTSNRDIYAQRIDVNGIVQWSSDGIPICNSVNYQGNVEIIPDGNGGAIIAWNDNRNGNIFDLYAQKVNSNGIVQWSNDGIPICTTEGSNYNPQMISDGNGGVIIAWIDHRTNNNSGDIYAQYVNSTGIAQWITDGIVICGNTAQNGHPRIISDGGTGAIIAWTDTRNSGNSFDIYAQRINSSGVVQWVNDGVPISTAPGAQASLSIISDNNGGAIISWTDLRNSISDIYSQRVNSNGVVQWANDGVPICNSANSQNSPIMVSDNNDGAIITWTDYRTSGNSADVYAQRINFTGATQWTNNGIPISATSYSQWLTNIIPDGNNGAIITWEDKRLGVYSDIYAQRVDFNGTVEWAVNGEPVSTASNIQRNPFIASDLSGGAIIAWADYRSETDYDVFAQHINMDGILSNKEFYISDNLNIFPNPSRGKITFQSVKKISNIYIINYLGEIVYEEDIISSTKKEIDLSNLSNGLYIYKIILDNKAVSNGKIIIAR